MSIQYGEPCAANGWNLGGPSPDTHEYMSVSRSFGAQGMPYMRKESFFAESAAVIVICIHVQSCALDGSTYQAEDGIEWFNRADRARMIFW